MKKIYILAAVALVASAACTKIETNEAEIPSTKISFSTANYLPQTKAGEASFLSEFTNPADARFQCKAFMVGEGVTGTQNFFGTDGETISWNATAKEWAPSHDYYWPKSAKSYINFFSWYDTGAGPVVTNGTMKWENRTIGTGDNIMYADPAWHFQKNTKAPTYGLDGVSEGVPTLFHHALSQIEFKVYADKLSKDPVVSSWTIKLTDVKIGSIYNQGTLSLTSTEPAATEFNQKGTWNTAAWTTSGTTGNLTPADLTVSATTAAGANVLLANQSVLPQSLTDVKLTFKLDITTNYTAGESNHEIINTEILLTDFGQSAWELNKKYIYTLKIVPSENRVLFDPAVEKAWETVNVAEKEL